MTTNISKLENASTVYDNIFQEIYQGSTESSDTYKKWCYEMSKIGRAVEFDITHGFALPEEWKGTKTFKSLRASKVRIPTKDYQTSHNVSKLEIKQQPDLVGAALRSFVSHNRNYVNTLVIQKLITGATEVQSDTDGVAFFSTLHPMDDGTTVSNYTTSALSATTYRAAAIAMRNAKDRSGMLMNIKPKYLLIGPNNEYIARDILVAKSRTQAVSNAGALDGTSNVVGGGSIENTVSMDGVEIIVDPTLNGTSANYWFLIGEGSGVKPMVVNMAQAPTPTDNTNDFLANSPEYKFSIEAQLGIGFTPVWQCMYGGFAS